MIGTSSTSTNQHLQSSPWARRAFSARRLLGAAFAVAVLAIAATSGSPLALGLAGVAVVATVAAEVQWRRRDHWQCVDDASALSHRATDQLLPEDPALAHAEWPSQSVHQARLAAERDRGRHR